MHIQQNSGLPKTDEQVPDLWKLAKTLWKGRRTLVKVIFFTGMMGLLVALISPVEYTSSTTMVPQTSQSGNKLGGLSSLAAMAGFNLDMGNGGEALSPMVYPQIINSGPFQLELMNTPFNFSEVDRPVSLYEYYSEIKKPGVAAVVKRYTVGLPGILLKAIKGSKKGKSQALDNQPIEFTDKQEEVRKLMKEKIILIIDSKQGYLTLQASFHEALLSAQVASQARELLQKYITRFKIEKAASQLSFIEQRYQEKKKEFEKAQNRLAAYRDQNRNMSSALARTEEERLQGEFNIAMNVYNELAKQLENAKIQVKEETPVFSVLQPAIIPVDKSKPKTAVILLIWLFLGAILGACVLFGREHLDTMKQKWNENDPPALN